ncbi:SDR family oxidoreductase [Streptomyces sp. NPDC048282]|uniref:SDR family oxidoreductase n=1 Tax=Streptomyces sp. NPDC048282 TaxID=3365528 RepID=UPI0037189760
MSGEFAGRTVLVTGGGRGIGRVISLAFARRGAHVVVNCFHSEREARRTLEEVQAEGGSGEVVRASVGSRDGVRALFDTVGASRGRLDVLVNNAVYGVLGAFGELDDEDWRRTLDVNLHGVRWCVEAALPLMPAGGSVINLSVQATRHVLDRYVALAASRGAADSLTRYLAAELGPRGIRVNSVSACYVESEALDYWPDRAERTRRAVAGTAVGRLPAPEDVAEAVVFLASGSAGAITGATLPVDAGMSLWLAGTPPRTTRAPVAAVEETSEGNPEETPPALPDRADEAVAVVGMGIAVPGASSPEEFWSLLGDDRNTFGEPPFSLDNWFSEDPSAEDKTYVRAAGYLKDLTPHPRLARERAGHPDGRDATTDLLRHCVLQCLDTARLDGHRVGVHIGTVSSSLALEEATLLAAVTEAEGTADGPLRRRLAARYPAAAPDPRAALPDRMLRAACAGLLPAGSAYVALDTACSSSLYAIDLGVKSLLDGESDLVLCGGANTGPRRDLVLFSKLRGLSPTGQVRSFDADADGVLFSDAAAVIALKRLDRALRDGDEILGVLGGFGASVDGTGSVLAPDPEGQKQAVRRARAVNGTAPGQVDWIVGHGTGAVVGDTAELEGLSELADGAHHLCTSNKPQTGHGAWAAGAVSVVHALLALRHASIPAERFFHRTPEHIKAPAITVPVEAAPWPPRAGRVRTAGICAYGLGGGNAHLLLHGPEAATDPAPAQPRPPADGPDPMVLIGWQAHLPGAPGRARVLAWLRGEAAAPPASFGEEYPLPPFKELRMPPVSARSVDRTHLMATGLVTSYATEFGEPWDACRQTTGVFTGHMGPTRAMSEYTVRVAYDDLTDAAEGKGSGRLRVHLDRLRDRLPAVNDAVTAGQLANLVSCRIANRLHLGGMAMALDSGRASTQAALHTAARYLASGELDLALVVGACGHSGPVAAELAGARGETLGEGAVLLVLTRASVARRHGWPPLARIGLDAPGPELPETGLPDGTARYQGAEGALALVRALDGGRASVLRNADDGPRITVIPTETETRVPAPSVTPVRDRSVIVLRRRDATPLTPAAPAASVFPPGILVLTDSADLARHLAGPVRTAGGHLLSTDPASVPGDSTTVAAGPAESAPVAASVAGITGTPCRDLLIVSSVRRPDNDWPAPPPDRLLRLQEFALLAVRQVRPGSGGSVAALVLDPLRGQAEHPHATLLTGFLRSLDLELACPTVALVTDATLEAGFGQLAAERSAHRDRTVVHYRQGLRYLEESCPAPLPETRDGTPLALPEDAVIVATGGARGATAVCLTALARRIRPRLWLLGTCDPDEAPEELVRTAGQDLPAARRAHLLHALNEQLPGTVADFNRRFDTLLRAREARLTLERLTELCGPERVHYLRCDVRDLEQVEKAARQVYDQDGAVDLLVHGAGVIRSAGHQDKTLTDFRAVRDTKVAGYHHLKAAFADPPPRLWCSFTSGSGFTGCPGDTDYSPANAYLGAAARHTDDAGTEEFALGWGLWLETGMVHEQAARLEREHGITALGNADGAAVLIGELTAPRPADPAPLYGLVNSWRIKGRPAYTAPPVPVGGLLDDRTPGEGRWTWRPDPLRDTYLADHVVDSRPLLPAVMMLELAAEAALRLRPGATVCGFAAMTIDEPLYAHPKHATLTAEILAEPAERDRVQVEVRSTLTAAQGRPLGGVRRHCRVQVLLGPRERPPAQQQPPRPPHRMESCPTARPDSSVQLAGVWHTNARCAAGPQDGQALWRPALEPEGIFSRLTVPALLIDSTARLFGYPPQPGGEQGTGVPVSIARIDLHTPLTDTELALAHPEGLRLWFTAADDRAVAATPDGTPQLTVTGLKFHVTDLLAQTVRHPEWRP